MRLSIVFPLVATLATAATLYSSECSSRFPLTSCAPSRLQYASLSPRVNLLPHALLAPYQVEDSTATYTLDADSLDILPEAITPEVITPEVIPSEVIPPELITPVEKSPPWAAVRSAILPGWGQFYTENYVRCVLFAGVQVGLFSLWYTEKRAADRDLDTYHRTDDATFQISSSDHRSRASNYFSWGLVVSLASVLDAYIDAHLYRFEEKVRMDDEGRVEVSVRLY